MPAAVSLGVCATRRLPVAGVFAALIQTRMAQRLVDIARTRG
jgi:hypothetical protein